MKRADFDWTNPSWVNLFVTLPWGIGIPVAIFGWSADHTIAQRERTTIGVISDHTAGRSDRYRYRFSLDDANFEGSSGSDDRYNIGDQVTVFYDPADPNKNALTDYSDLAIRNFVLVPFALTGIGGFAWYIWYARGRKKSIRDP